MFSLPDQDSLVARLSSSPRCLLLRHSISRAHTRGPLGLTPRGMRPRPAPSTAAPPLLTPPFRGSLSQLLSGLEVGLCFQHPEHLCILCSSLLVSVSLTPHRAAGPTASPPPRAGSGAQGLQCDGSTRRLVRAVGSAPPDAGAPGGVTRSHPPTPVQAPSGWGGSGGAWRRGGGRAGRGDGRA